MNWITAIMSIAKIKTTLSTAYEALVKAAAVINKVAQAVTEEKYKKTFTSVALILSRVSVVIGRVLEMLGVTVPTVEVSSKTITKSLNTDELDQILKDLEKIRI
jgi:hypothetical protein